MGCQASFVGSWVGCVGLRCRICDPGGNIKVPGRMWWSPRRVVGNAATAALRFAEIYSPFGGPS